MPCTVNSLNDHRDLIGYTQHASPIKFQAHRRSLEVANTSTYYGRVASVRVSKHDSASPYPFLSKHILKALSIPPAASQRVICCHTTRHQVFYRDARPTTNIFLPGPRKYRINNHGAKICRWERLKL